MAGSLTASEGAGQPVRETRSSDCSSLLCGSAEETESRAVLLELKINAGSLDFLMCERHRAFKPGCSQQRKSTKFIYSLRDHSAFCLSSLCEMFTDYSS